MKMHSKIVFAAETSLARVTTVSVWMIGLSVLVGTLCVPPAMGATITYTGAATGNLSSNWLVSTNWNPARVPAEGDDVVIGFGTVVLPQTPSFATLTLNGGKISGQFVNRGIIKWLSGTIAGQLTIAAGGVLELDGPDQKNLEECALHNFGTIRWNGTGGIVSSTTVAINNQAGGVFEARNDSFILHASFSVPAVFSNTGVFRKSGGTGATSVQNVSFHNSGRVEIQTGILSFPTGLANGGTIEVAAGAKLDLSGGKTALQLGSVITGEGFYGVTGKVDIEGMINSPNFQLTGTLEGTNTVTGRMVWTTGTIRSKLTVAASGTLELIGPDQKNLEECSIHNSGHIRWSGTGGISSSTAVMINNQAGGVFEAQNDSSILHASFSVPAVFNNAGVFRKKGGTNVTAIQNVAFNNTGRVEIQTGSVSFPDGFANSGTFDVADGARLDLTGGKVALQSGSTITGAGFYGVTGKVDVEGTINSPNFQLTGTLEGTNTVTGRLVWTAGTIRSKLTIVAGGTLELSGSDHKQLEENTLNNSGTIRWSGSGGIQSSTAVAIHNQAGGVFEAQSDSTLLHASFSVPAMFNNEGVFRKSGGADATIVQNVAFSNTGRLEIQSGTLEFSGDYTQSKGATVLSGGTLKAAKVNIDGGVLSGTGTVRGNVSNRAQLSPTRLAIDGNYAQTAAGILNLQLGGFSQFDTLAISGQAALDGTLNVTMANAFLPRPGNSFRVLTYASRNGTFANMKGLDLGAEQSLTADLGATSLLLFIPSPYTLSRTPDGLFKVRFEGKAGALYLLEGSVDLVNWVTLTPAPVANIIEFTDAESAKQPRVFYRVRTP